MNSTETRLEPTLAQTLHMVNGDTIQGKLGRSTVIADMLKAKADPDQIIGELYLRTVSRKPSELEMRRMRGLVAGRTADRSAYEDIFWALLNSTEFSFNH